MNKSRTFKKIIIVAALCCLITIAFILLKLTNLIAWSWVWVLSPLWLPLSISFIIFFCSLLFLFIHNLREDTGIEKWQNWFWQDFKK